MRDDVKRDLGNSAYDFFHTVWPGIAGCCQGGELYPIESTKDRGFISRLDQFSGIDAFQVISSKGVMRGIASRVQYLNNLKNIDRPPKTFTLRYWRSTSGSKDNIEFSKRLDAIQHADEGYLYPHLTVQAYMTEPRGQLLSVGITLTKPLYLYTQRFISDRTRVYMKEVGADKNLFLVVNWCRYQSEGNPLKVRTKQQRQVNLNPSRDKGAKLASTRNYFNPKEMS